MTIYRHISVRRTAGALGADIECANLDTIDDATFEEIRLAFAEHQVVYFRNQDLTPTSQANFTRRFGSLTHNPMLSSIDAHPDVAPVFRAAETKGFAFGGKWHADGSFMERPGLVSTLYAQDLPPYGGDTLFSSCGMAYDTLSPGMQALCDTLIVVHSAARAYDPDRGTAEKRGVAHKEVAYVQGEDPKKEVEHPLVCFDPLSGRKVLWITGPYCLRFKDMTEEESATLLGYLQEHAQNPNFTARFSYQPGTLGMWNNRAVIHFAICDYTGHRRLLHRVQAEGVPPVGPAMPKRSADAQSFNAAELAPSIAEPA